MPFSLVSAPVTAKAWSMTVEYLVYAVDTVFLAFFAPAPVVSARRAARSLKSDSRVSRRAGRPESMRPASELEELSPFRSAVTDSSVACWSALRSSRLVSPRLAAYRIAAVRSACSAVTNSATGARSSLLTFLARSVSPMAATVVTAA